MVKGTDKDTDEHVIKERKKDLNKIVKFLVRQSMNEGQTIWDKLQEMTFWQFLYATGMFKEDKILMSILCKKK